MGNPPAANRGRAQSTSLLEEWVRLAQREEGKPPILGRMERLGVRSQDRAQWHLTFKVTSQMELLEFKGSWEAPLYFVLSPLLASSRGVSLSRVWVPPTALHFQASFVSSRSHAHWSE